MYANRSYLFCGASFTIETNGVSLTEWTNVIREATKPLKQGWQQWGLFSMVQGIDVPSAWTYVQWNKYNPGYFKHDNLASSRLMLLC